MATAKKAPAKKAPAKKAAPAKAASAAKKAVPAKKAAAHTSRGVAQDRALVAGKQSYEVSYVSKLTKKTPAEVKKAIEEKGHSRVKVVEAQGGVKKPARKPAKKKPTKK
jgi:hypothetical protein